MKQELFIFLRRVPFQVHLFVMNDSTKIKMGESSRTMAQMKISEIVSSKITNRKVDGNNYLH